MFQSPITGHMHSYGKPTKVPINPLNGFQFPITGHMHSYIKSKVTDHSQYKGFNSL